MRSANRRADRGVASEARLGELAESLRRAGVTDVLHDDASRAHYSSDASLYRILPMAVVRPRDVADVEATLEVARALGTAVVPRGAGTSVAGNAIGTGVILDFSRYMNRVVRLDPEARTAVVQPGVIQGDLEAAAREYGLLFGPDPSTKSRCTVGGMIGNNACGSRSLAYGRTSDNVSGLTAVLAAGTTLHLSSHDQAGWGTTEPAAVEVLARLHDLTRRGLGVIRTEFGRFPRQVSGYALEHLLPERGFDIAKLLVGSEGTLAVVTEATVRLVKAPKSSTLVVLGFDTMAGAADATPSVLQHRPTACEGLDSRIVDVVRERQGSFAVPALPRGRAWLFVELAGVAPDELEAAARRLIRDVDCLDARVVDRPAEADALWRIRADGAGLSGRTTQNLPAYAGWEDAAVPPDRLGDYIRGFEALMESYGFSGFPFGHFGEGCLHVRLDFPLESAPGVEVFDSFIEDAADLVALHGGSLSGEHGDGRARSRLLDTMYSAEARALFAEVKDAFDPAGVLNPGVIVDPNAPTSNLRVPASTPIRLRLGYAYPEDDGDFSRAVHRCTGVGACRAPTKGGVMCPSFMATGDEKDSTRGRARVLQELANGSFVGDWSAPAIHESLDLCLSCKGCASDCPTGVDMATYKAEVLYQTYRGRLRPRTHYSLGWLPVWARVAARAPRLSNALLRLPGLSRLVSGIAGIDARREMPRLASRSFRRGRRASIAGGDLGEVVLFVDTFSDLFAPSIVEAAVRVLADSGYRAVVVPRQGCCGLTWISTGQLDTAKRQLRRLEDSLAPWAESGVPIVGLEPSCTAVLRSEAPVLLGTRRAHEIARHTFTLAEFLADQAWEPPDLSGTTVVAQPHCHHHAVMGWHTDERLLSSAGATITRVSGCCGLAGNFGVERGHYDVSAAVAGLALLPAVEAQDTATVLADGFSCRTQLVDLAGRRALHLAELLAAGLDAASADAVRLGRER